MLTFGFSALLESHIPLEVHIDLLLEDAYERIELFSLADGDYNYGVLRMSIVAVKLQTTSKQIRIYVLVCFNRTRYTYSLLTIHNWQQITDIVAFYIRYHVYHSFWSPWRSEFIRHVLIR